MKVSLLVSKKRVYPPYPLGAGSARPNPKMGAPDPENPLFLGFCVLRGGLRPWSQTMVSEGARPWGRGRSGDCEPNASKCLGGCFDAFFALVWGRSRGGGRGRVGGVVSQMQLGSLAEDGEGHVGPGGRRPEGGPRLVAPYCAIPRDYLWDPFGHSEGSSRPNVKKSEKSLEMGSQGLPAPGDKKVRKELKTRSKLTFLRLFNSFLTLF